MTPVWTLSELLWVSKPLSGASPLLPRLYSHLCSQGEPLQADIRLCPPPMAPTSVRVKAQVLTRPTRTCLTWPSVSSPFLPSHPLPQSLLVTPSCSWHLHRQTFIHILCLLMTSYIVYFSFLHVVSFVSL